MDENRLSGFEEEAKAQLGWGISYIEELYGAKLSEPTEPMKHTEMHGGIRLPSLGAKNG